MSSEKDNLQEKTQQVLYEIMKSFKEKYFIPIIEENNKLKTALEHERETLSQLKEKIDSLEKKVENNPVTVLTAIKDAINQSYGGNNNGTG